MTIALDEGGLRCLSGREGEALYVPYDVIEDATIANTYFGRTLLVLVLDLDLGGHVEMEIEIANGNPFDVLGAVIAHVARPHASSRLPQLGRKGMALDAWLARVRGGVTGEATAGYRETMAGAVDVPLLAATLDDADAPVDERAAAAHALLEIASDDALFAVASVLVARAVPPIVIVAVRFGRGGRAIVDEDVLTDMRALLSADDARAVTATLAVREDPEVEARIATALERAQRAAVEEIERARASSARGRRLAHATGGITDPARWIGRSWAL